MEGTQQRNGGTGAVGCGQEGRQRGSRVGQGLGIRSRRNQWAERREAGAEEPGAVLAGELKAVPEGEAAQVPPLRQYSQHWSSSHLSPVYRGWQRHLGCLRALRKQLPPLKHCRLQVPGRGAAGRTIRAQSQGKRGTQGRRSQGRGWGPGRAQAYHLVVAWARARPHRCHCPAASRWDRCRRARWGSAGRATHTSCGHRGWSLQVWAGVGGC